MPVDLFIVPPPGTLGVWTDVRPLEDYPAEPKQRRGPPPRAVVSFRGVLETWVMRGSLTDRDTLTNLRTARKQILAFREQAMALGARRAQVQARRRAGREIVDPVPYEPAPAIEPISTVNYDDDAVPVPPAPSSPPLAPPMPEVPQDDFMAALAAVFG